MTSFNINMFVRGFYVKFQFSNYVVISFTLRMLNNKTHPRQRMYGK